MQGIKTNYYRISIYRCVESEVNNNDNDNNNNNKNSKKQGK